ncbi:MAG: response regulator [Desulfobulbaceae bacterium]|nr:response regulator [Desulfobulbaceae bacterium]
METPIVLFVDDEPNILKTLRRLFMDEEYDVHTAGNGREALELIEGGLTPTIIVSDQRMPEMGGAEFLAKAAQLVPDSIRMVLTGYADINAAMQAINQGGIYRYIMKPWNDNDLRITVREALAHFNLVAENRLLSQELAEKNKTLSQMNEQLEEMVKIRTQELHQKVHELEGRDTIQQFLLSVHPLEELLQTVLTVVVDVCGLDAAAYYAVSEENMLERLAVCSSPAGKEQTIEDNAVLPLIQSRLPLLSLAVADGGGGQVFDDEQVRYGLTPVAKGSQLFGVLLAKRSQGEPFSEAERASMLSFARQAAIGIKDCHVHNNYDTILNSLDGILEGIKDFDENVD